MIANDIIVDVTKHPRFKEALEEMATHDLSQFGNVSVVATMDVTLDAGSKRVRVTMAMVDAGEEFAEDE